MSAIAKYFPKGYVIHDKSGFNRLLTPCKTWMVIEHWGKTDDDLEWYVAVTGIYNGSMAEAIKELQSLR